MRHWALLLCLLFGTGTAVADGPFLRVSISPKQAIVGQAVRVTVDVMVPNFFTGAPDFPEFELDNAIVVLSGDTPEHINLTVHGKFFAGIRRTYSMYPEQSGSFTLPPAEIHVPYAAHPPETTVANLPLPPGRFEAVIPAEAQNLDYFLPTTALRLSQKWSTSLKGLRVGDTFDRTITVTTVRMQAMFIPPLALEAPDGLRIYPANPVVEDEKTDRGVFVEGRRVERATYLIEKEGQYTLPKIELQWWDLSAGRIRVGTLPEITINAAANPNYVAEIPPEAAPVAAVLKQRSLWDRYRRRIYLLLVLATVSAIFVWLIRRYASRLLSRWREYRNEAENSEAACFKRLVRVCRENRATEAYRLLLVWLARSRRDPDLDHFLQQSNDPDLSSEVGNLTTILFSENRETPWAGHRLRDALKRNRRIQKARSRHLLSIPGLNP